MGAGNAKEKRIPKQLKTGEYEFVEEIISNSICSATILVASTKDPNFKFFLKYFSKETGNSKVKKKERETLYLQEYRFLERAEHPHIATIIQNAYDSADKSRGFMVQYFKSLETLLQEEKGRLYKFINAEEMLTQVLDALNYAYDKLKVVHLNLTPRCIMYSETDRRFIVSDWEKIFTYDQEDPIRRETEHLFLDAMKTNEDSIYLAPEVRTLSKLETKRINPNSSVYSLGLIYLEVLGLPKNELEKLKKFDLETNYYTSTVTEFLDRVEVNDDVKDLIFKKLTFYSHERIGLSAALHELEDIISKRKNKEIQGPLEILEQKKSRLLFLFPTQPFYFGETEAEEFLGHYAFKKDLFSDSLLFRGELSKAGEREGGGENLFESTAYYLGFWKNNKQNGKGKMIYETGEIYEGEWKDGLRHGEGTCYSNSGKIIYMGNFINDKYHGHGQLCLFNGDEYKGEFCEGEFHGEGVFYFSEAEVKQMGSWKNGQKEGKFLSFAHNGELVEETFWQQGKQLDMPMENLKESSYKSPKEFEENFVRVTKKKQNFSNQKHNTAHSTYLAEPQPQVQTNTSSPQRIKFVPKIIEEQEEIKDGFHEVTYTNGDRYSGTWKAGKWDGKGKWVKGNSLSFYDGGYAAGKRHGMGKMKFENCDIYEGEWADGKKQGQGKYTWYSESDKKAIYIGSWLNDKREGRGKMIYENGDEYDGEWKDNLFEECGTYTWEDGRKYVGQFKEGLQHGVGRMDYKDGDWYDGQWKEDKYHGEGTYCLDSEEFRGIFENGELKESLTESK